MASDKKNSPTVSLFRKHQALIVFILIVIVFMEVVYILYDYQNSLKKELVSTGLAASFTYDEMSDYPVVQSVYEPFLTADSAVVVDNNSQKILYSKNPNLRFSMASTTKVMSVLTALEEFAYNDILTVKRKFNEGSLVGFEAGEQVYFDDLLYATLLPSGNDAAYILADNYPGGLEAFVGRMNEKAKEYNLKQTHFQDPAGLNDDLNYTTALDLARFSSVALKNPTLARVVGTQRKVFTDVSGQKTYDVYNLNKLLGSQGVVGIKTGTTVGAGEVLTTAVRQGEKEYIIVVMKSEDRFADTQNLIDFTTQNVSYINPQELTQQNLGL